MFTWRRCDDSPVSSKVWNLSKISSTLSHHHRLVICVGILMKNHTFRGYHRSNPSLTEQSVLCWICRRVSRSFSLIICDFSYSVCYTLYWKHIFSQPSATSELDFLAEGNFPARANTLIRMLTIVERQQLCNINLQDLCLPWVWLTPFRIVLFIFIPPSRHVVRFPTQPNASRPTAIRQLCFPCCRRTNVKSSAWPQCRGIAFVSTIICLLVKTFTQEKWSLCLFYLLELWFFSILEVATNNFPPIPLYIILWVQLHNICEI